VGHSTTAPILRKASTNLGQSAKAIAAKSGRTALSASDYEILIGLGIALDWIGWARDLDCISYTNSKRESFERAYGTSELTRFTFMWTAANALFSRGSILSLIDPSTSGIGSELERFRILFDGSWLADVDEKAYVNNLHAILSMPMHVQHFPWTAVNSPQLCLK
jgi:hypothetical protein